MDNNTDPDPRRTPGLKPGGTVPPGETPPGEDSTSGAGPRDTQNPTKGWAKGPLAAIAVVTGLMAAFFLVYAVFLWTRA
ncbi:DUF6480 family protein [Streptomyces sp. 549]|uniref:DUF6480 family protein n=1 Tax=Streptomyces sp. 549 TaxID=3049076 RepID=UPI0024C3AE57|nr:DUF6480 family protein [Streptomyces sp. 549]MDK1472853.1 DUF6480 family protein [Streptomyces sp. 549]